MKNSSLLQFKIFFITLLYFSALFLSTCVPLEWPFGVNGRPTNYIYRFSIKNETNYDLTASLVVGEIPNAQAGFAELTPVPDEVLQIFNHTWSNELGAHCSIKPNRHDAVYNLTLPICGLTKDIVYNPDHEGDFEEALELKNKEREYFLDKLFSFVLTIRRGDEIIYKIAGWDVPVEDMVEHHIDDTMYSYYDTAPESYWHNGINYADPLLYSKLWEEKYSTSWEKGLEAATSSSLTYFIKVTTNGTFLQEFNPISTHVNENHYWENN